MSGTTWPHWTTDNGSPSAPCRQILWEATFAGQQPGGLVTLPSGLVLTRATAATVQTGTSVVDSTPGVNVARIGRMLDADRLALVIEESRKNWDLRSDDLRNHAVWALGTAAEAAGVVGPDGTTLSSRFTALANQYAGYQSLGNRAAGFYSQWAKGAIAGAQTLRLGYGPGGSTFANFAISDAAWTRIVQSDAGGVGCYHTLMQQAAAGPACDAYIAAAQFEEGAFPTEYIPTAGAAATRAVDRLYIPDTVAIVDGGRLSMEWVLRPKASSAVLASTTGFSYLFSFLGGDPVGGLFLRNAPLRFDQSVGGVNKNSGATAFSWAANDTVRIWYEGGNGPTKLKIMVNAAAPITLIDDAVVLGALPTGISCDFFGSTGGGNVFSTWCEEMRAFRNGFRPAWAA